MKNKFSFFMLFFCGMMLLTCASIISIKYNSNYISYNYLNLLTFQKNGQGSNTDDPQNENSDIMKKPKRSRFDRSEMLDISSQNENLKQLLSGYPESTITGKTQKVQNNFIVDSYDIVDFHIFGESIQYETNAVLINILFLNQEISSNLIQDLSKLTKSIESQIIIQNVFDALYNELTASTTQIHGFDIKDENEIAMFLLFACFIAIVFASNRNEKNKLKNTKFLSIFFIVILLSSVTLTPFALRQSYWGMAFAEPINQTNDILSNSTMANTTSLSLNDTNETNRTQSGNGTVDYNIPVSSVGPVLENQTNSSISKHLFSSLSDVIDMHDNFTNLQNHVSYQTHTNITLSSSTGIDENVTILHNGTAHPIQENSDLSTGISTADNITTLLNGTAPPVQNGFHLSTNLSVTDSINVTRMGIIVPEATKSWNFTSTNDTIGKAMVKNNTLNLQGNGYLKESVNSTNTLNNFTVSAWVQPDYSQGSSVFSVITKSRQFALDVNNNIAPSKAATFSIFDGIRWNTVNSTIPIPENSWTYLVGVYNGTSISLYANGTLQSSYKLQGALSISDDGHLVPVNPDQISSNSDMIIGASVNSVRSSVADKFSGGIQNVNFYKEILGPEQISKIYQSAQTENQIPAHDTVLAESMAMTDSILASLNNTSTNNTAMNAIQVVPTIEKTKTSYSMSENPEFVYQIFNDSDLKKIRTEAIQAIQQNTWNEKNTTISVKILSPNGTEIPVTAQFKKLKEGQFDIKIPSKRFGKPGMYTIKTTLVKNGKIYTTQEQYAWGLVSVNTDRSIYKPGQTANMTIVVLDSNGSPVCDAAISMNVLAPDSSSTSLSSGNDITQGSECGLYSAQYKTASEGNYTVNVSAKENSINTSFSTSFLVQNDFPFDIIRTAQSKIDPKSNPNLFHVKIDATSFVNATNVTIQESVPAVFEVTTDGVVQTVGDTKIISWNRNLASNKTSVEYSYSVPMIFPQLYALGPAKIEYENNTFTESRQWFVANDPPVDTIQFDGVPTSQGFSTTATNTEKNMSLTIGNNPNRLLLVQVVLNSATAVITVSWKGIHLTPIGTGNINSTKTIQFFYLVNPPTGTDNVVVDTTVDLSTKGVIGAYSLYGVDQTTPVIKSGTNTKATSAAPSITLTNSHDNSMLIDLAANPSAIFGTSNCATCTIAWNNNGGASTIQAGSQWERVTTAGISTAFSWTLASSKAWLMTGVEVLPAGIVGQTEVMAISDQISLIVNRTQLISNSVGISDQVSASRVFTGSDSDQVSISDQLSVIKIRKISLSDSVSMSDQSTTALHFNEHYYDGQPVTITTNSTQLAHYNPSIPAGDNLIIVSAQFDGSSTTSIATVSSGSLQLKKNNITLASNPFDINIEGDTQGTKQASTVLFYKDVGASANPTYDVTSLASQNISGKVTILVIHEALNSSFGNSTVISLPSAKTTIFSHTPSLTSGDNLILAEINLHNTAGAARTFAAGAINIGRNGVTLSSNQNSFQLDAVSAVINSHSVLLIANDTNAPANPTYDVTTDPSSTGVNGQVQIFIIQGLEYSFVHPGNVALTTTDSTLASDNIVTNGPTDEIAVIAGVETKSGTTSLRTINPEGLKLSMGGVTQSSNEFGIEMKSAGTQFRDHVLLDSSIFGQNPTFNVMESQTSANNVNAEAKIVVIDLSRRFISLTDSMSIADSIGAVKSKTHLISLSDSVAVSENMTKSISLALSDSVAISENMTKSISLALSDSVQISDSSETVQAGSNQLVVFDTTQTVTIQPGKTDLLVANNNTALSTITVPSTVSTATLNYSKIVNITSNSTTVGIVNSLEIAKDLDGNGSPDVYVILPANVTIRGNSAWKGDITLPTVTSTPTIPVVFGQTNDVTKTIKVGSDSVSLSFDKAVKLVFTGEAGQKVGYFNSVTSFTEITSTCSDNTQTTNDGLVSGGDCKINAGSDLIVWTKHFTGFSTYTTSASTTSSSTSSITSNAGGGGSIGASPSSGPSGESAVEQGGILSNLQILDVSYDTCNTNTVKILVAYSDSNPSVVLRTSLTGIVQAIPAKEQPFAAENENATIQKLVYEAPISSKETTFEVLALQAMGSNVNSVGKTIDITSCQGETSFEQEQAITPVATDTSAPRIFDVKFQLDNGTEISSSEDNQFVDSQPVSVFAIVDSKSALESTELRFTKLDNATNYQTITMQTTPLQISNTTYLLSATIPSQMLQTLAISYWVNVQNSVGKTSESDHYLLGVKPIYDISGKLEFDLKHQSRPEGSIGTPTAYFTNYSDGPLYGTISMIVDGKKVYTSPTQEFDENQTAVPLEWKAPASEDIVAHHLNVVGEFYGKSITSDIQTVTTFDATKIVPISSPINIDVLKDNGGNTVALPLVLHSSYLQKGSENFKVIAPDGTCVIGPLNCLVTNSTDNMQQYVIVNIGDQTYKVRYFEDSPFERFTISSVDPIVGQWHIEIDSNGIPQHDALTDKVSLHIKYTPAN